LSGAVVAEGGCRLDGPRGLGFGCVKLVPIALASAEWFTGLRHLDAGTLRLVGLLNPVTGVLLGTVIAAEALSVRQVCGLVLVLAGILIPHLGRRPSRPYDRKRAETVAQTGFSHDRTVRRG
jgi:probable blue pigment (indigoidine) exporter